MQLTSLFEAGVRTAAIETAAGKALRTELPKRVAQYVENITPSLRPARYPKGHDEESSDLVDRIDELGREHKNLYATTFCEIAGQILTDVLRDHLRVVAPTIPSFVKYYTDACGPTGVEQFVRENRCVIDVKELSTDPYAAKSGGYFDSLNSRTRIFVPYEVAQSACGDCMMQAIVGEMDGYAFKFFIKEVLSTFAHEYAHCEQNMRNPYKEKKSPLKGPGVFRDRTMITPTIPGKNRTPKRGGMFRTPERSPLDRLQYYGSLHEIDSFASGAASDLISSIDRYEGRYGRQDPHEFNDQIESIKYNLTLGYSNSDDATHYLALLRGRFDKEIADMKVKPNQIEKVWKRFAKLLCQKLDDYKMDGSGMMERDQKPFATYQGIINGMTPSQAVAHLSGITAQATFEDTEMWGDLVKTTLEGYGRYLEEMERFLAFKYYKSQEYDPSFDKMRTIFRRMVARKIAELEAQAEHRKAA